MGKANERQVAGDHYRSNYQHWDFVLDMKMGYLEGCASKYVSRWRKKSGVVDLEKAQHYCTKGAEALPLAIYMTQSQQLKLSHFTLANELTPAERDIIYDIVERRWRDAGRGIARLIDTKSDTTTLD